MITIREEILAHQPIHQIWHNLPELSWAGNKKNQIFEGINLSRSWNVNIFERCKHFSETNWREFLKKAQKERGFLSEYEKKLKWVVSETISALTDVLIYQLNFWGIYCNSLIQLKQFPNHLHLNHCQPQQDNSIQTIKLFCLIFWLLHQNFKHLHHHLFVKFFPHGSGKLLRICHLINQVSS